MRYLILLISLFLTSLASNASPIKTVFVNSYEDPNQSLQVNNITPSKYIGKRVDLPQGTKGWIGWKFDISSSAPHIKVKVNLYNAFGNIVSTHHWWGYPVQSSLSFEVFPSGSYIEGALWVSMQCHAFGASPNAGECTIFTTIYAE